MNIVEVVGRMHGDLYVHHTIDGEAFLNGTIAVQRSSGTVDYLPITITEKLLTMNGMPRSLSGQALRLTGEIRSYNKMIGGKSRLLTPLYVRQIAYATDIDDTNRVELYGAICRPPSYRTTPFGRNICDLLLAVNRGYGKSAYIPCVVWGKNARAVRRLHVGDKLRLIGRFQSREYVKVLEDGSAEGRTAYEVSVKEICIDTKEV